MLCERDHLTPQGVSAKLQTWSSGFAVSTPSVGRLVEALTDGGIEEPELHLGFIGLAADVVRRRAGLVDEHVLLRQQLTRRSERSWAESGGHHVLVGGFDPVRIAVREQFDDRPLHRTGFAVGGDERGRS